MTALLHAAIFAVFTLPFLIVVVWLVKNAFGKPPR